MLLFIRSKQFCAVSKFGLAGLCGVCTGFGIRQVEAGDTFLAISSFGLGVLLMIGAFLLSNE